MRDAPPGGVPVGDALPCAFFGRPVVEVARDLLGCTFLYGGVGGRAGRGRGLPQRRPGQPRLPRPHAAQRRHVRTAGRLYVYFTMGLHFCVNVVCQGEGEAAAVLLRALEPTVGLETMRARRGLTTPRQLCSGPAKLTQALGITRRRQRRCRACPTPSATATMAQAPRRSRRRCERRRCAPSPAFCRARASRRQRPGVGSRAPRIVATPRIGVTSAADTPWRFVDADSPFLSRPLPRVGRS